MKDYRCFALIVVSLAIMFQIVNGYTRRIKRNKQWTEG